MSLLITESTINKLEHNLRDIRQKALQEVDTKLKQSVNKGDEIIFSSTALYKALIVALNDPKNVQMEILDTILTLFKSRYATSLVTVIGVPRIRNDTYNAIRRVTDTHPEFNARVKEFYRFLSKFESHDLTQELKKLSFKDVKPNSHNPNYVRCWSIPHETDLQEMRTLQMSLTDRNNAENIEHAINFVQGSVKNLPAEHFLQPPYLYKTLFACLELEKYERSILTILYDLTKLLQSRIKIRTMTRTVEYVLEDREVTQLSIPAYCYQLTMVLVHCLKEIEDNYNQEKLNLYFELMNAVVNLLKSSKGQYENRAILRELAILARFYREQYQNTKENNRFRVNFLTILQMITVVASCGSTNKEDDDVVGDDGEVFVTNWKKEMENCLLDFSLREAMPQVYLQIYEICNAKQNNRLEQIAHAGQILYPAIEVIRCPDKYSDEELVMNGISTLDTLKIHKSEGLIRKLMSAVINCAPYFNGNTELRNHGEALFLRLIATNVPKLKHLAYQIAFDAVKDFFTRVSDGTAGVFKQFDTEGSQYMGIPLNSDILTEISCFGMRNKSIEIHKVAEVIITYIVKGRPLLGKHWNKYFDLLLPLLPLLQAVTPVNTSLGRSIMQLIDPDFELPPRECIHGNMRYLFCNESQTREDALLRLLFMTSNSPHAMNYLPNIDHIRDTITNTFCIVRHRLPLRDPMKCGVYDVQSLRDHVEILKCQDSSPKVRFSALVQLNEFMDDPSLCDVLHQQKDWPYILKAFDNAMRINHNRDYPESAVPALQIIAKLCVRCPALRRYFAHDLDFNILFLRAMFMHHHDLGFRNDGATLMFLMAFHEFVVGEDDLSIPEVFSELFIPFQCKFHDATSPYDVTTLLESMFQEENEQAYDDLVIVIDEETSPKASRKVIPGGDQPKNEQWQYIRMTFTAVWFDGVDFVLENVNKNKTEVSLIRKYGPVDYKTLPQHLQQDSDILDFNPRLTLLEEDINLIKITSLSEIVKYNIHEIENATTHLEAVVGISGVKSIIFLPHYEEHHAKEFIKAIKRFIVTPPKSDDDEHLFTLVVNVLTHLILIGYDTILMWAVKQLNDSNSIFLRLLHDQNQSVLLYNTNVSFIKTVIKTFCCNKDELQEIIKIDDTGLVLRIFEIISHEIEVSSKDHIQSLLSLMRVVTQHGTIDTDDTLLNKVICQLFECLKVLKSLTQSGSFIAKNCLFSIGNLLKFCPERPFKPKSVRLLQALCGHTDTLVRGCSWSILSSIALNLPGATLIVDELSYLPGGIHACIIQTMLDPEEVSLVKGSAATLFVILLKHHNKNGLIPEVWPKCKESVEDKSKKDAFGLINEIFRKQQFQERVRDALDEFVPNIYIDPEIEIEMFTAPDTVIHLSNILISVSNVRGGMKLTESEKLSLEAFLKCTFLIEPSKIGSTMLAMVTSICNLFTRYLSHDISILAIILQNPWFMILLLKLLNLAHYETEALCELTCVNILHLIQVIAGHPQGYEHICVSLEQIPVDNLMHFFNFNMIGHENSSFRTDVMNCLTALVTGCQQEMINSNPFHALLDTVTIDDPLINKEIENDTGPRPASEILTKRLIQIFEIVCEQDQPQSGIFYISDVKLASFNCLSSFLRHTEHASLVAKNMNLFDKIILRFNTIACDIGISCRDFILKYGDRKKKPILQELGLLASLVSSWYCRTLMMDPTEVDQLLQSINNIWDWTFQGEDLNVRFLTVLMVLSEKSLIVCKALSTVSGLSQPTFLQRVADIAKTETKKVGEISYDRLKVAVRVLINCCSCVEGRNHLLKINVLDVFETIHPHSINKNKRLQKIIPVWLSFFEIFTRYPDGAGVKHLYVLCTLARKQTEALRIPALKILRNMAFHTKNRAALLTSPDFIYIVRDRLDFGSEDEQTMVVLALWKIVANSFKYKNEVKNSTTYKKLNDLSNRLAVKGKTDTQVYHVLSCLLNVLSTNN